jgi:hypothetical protein
VADGFQIGRAITGLLARPLPVANGLLCEPSLGIMMGQQPGLRLAALGKARLQHLGNALMVLLAGAPQQRLIGCFLDQGMLKEVRRLRWQPLLIQELRFHQLEQSTAQGPLVPRRDRLQQGIGKLAPQRRSELRQRLHRRQAIQPRHQ